MLGSKIIYTGASQKVPRQVEWREKKNGNLKLRLEVLEYSLNKDITELGVRKKTVFRLSSLKAPPVYFCVKLYLYEWE